MKRSQLIAGIAASPLAVPAFVRSAGAQELTTVRVGFLGISTDAPMWIADAKGYFRENGIQLQLTKFTSSETMMPLLAGTDLDIGNGAPGASLYNAVLRGIDIRAVADAATDPPGFGWSKLLIRTELVKNGKYKTFKDLKGMSIVGAAKASSSSAQVAKLLAKAGLKFTDVTRTVLPYPQHVIAFQNGAIDASLTIEPFATLATDTGAAVAMSANDQFYPNQEVSCVLCSSTFIKNRRDVIVRYLRGYLKGVRYYANALQGGKLAGIAADEIAHLISTKTGAPEDLIRRTVPVAMDLNGGLNLASMRDDLAFYKSEGFIEGGTINVEQVVDTTLSPEALKTIGIDRRRL